MREERIQAEVSRQKKSSAIRLTFSALCIVINLIGGLSAAALRLPVYLDSIGTFFAGAVMGPLAAAGVGALTSVVNAVTFDPVSIYFLPSQLVNGVLTGLLFYRSGLLLRPARGRDILRIILNILVITLAGSAVSSVIVGLVFDGVTSSGSSLIVAVLRNSGINILTAVFSTQILTDLLDRAISFLAVALIIRALPAQLLQKLGQSH